MSVLCSEESGLLRAAGLIFTPGEAVRDKVLAGIISAENCHKGD